VGDERLAEEMTRAQAGVAGARFTERLMAVYVWTVAGLWALSALPLVVRSAKLWSAGPLWYVPPFYDFGCFYDRIRLVHQPAFWTSMVGPVWDYPAPDVFVYELFYHFNRGNGGEHRVFFGFLAYLIFSGAVLLFAGVMLVRGLRRRGIGWTRALMFPAVLLLLCWPIYFGLQRGNIEFFLDAGVAAGLWAYVRRRWWLAAVLIGAFGTGKLYPLLLLGLLIPAKRWTELVFGVATAAGVTVAATWWIGAAPAGVKHSKGIWHGLQSWVMSNSMVFDGYRNGFDHSLFGVLKLMCAGHAQWLMPLALMYAAVGAVGMLVLFFGRTWKMPRANQMLLVSIGAVLLPPSSFDYTLVLLVPIFVWVMLLSAEDACERGRCWVVVLFAMLFAPETFATWSGVFFAGQLKMVGLLVLLAMAVCFPLRERDGVLTGAR
jgi:hypothetical protein